MELRPSNVLAARKDGQLWECSSDGRAVVKKVAARPTGRQAVGGKPVTIPQGAGSNPAIPTRGTTFACFHNPANDSKQDDSRERPLAAGKDPHNVGCVFVSGTDGKELTGQRKSAFTVGSSTLSALTSFGKRNDEKPERNEESLAPGRRQAGRC